MINCLLTLSILFFSLQTLSATRLKDLVTIKGVRGNPLIGQGIVIGLNGTGDGEGELSNKLLKKMHQKLGVNTTENNDSKNVAAVIVTANLPPYSRLGQRIDVTISSIGNASSLAGGTLLVTPLKGGDGETYAIASGALSVGGIKSGDNFSTTAKIPNGGIIEKEIKISFDRKKIIRLSLKRPDFTTAFRLQRTVNTELGGKFAIARDISTIDIVVPVHYQRKVVELMALLESFKVNEDHKAKIVINERTGTIVAGGDIKLSKVAIGHGDLLIEVEGDKKGDEMIKKRLFHLEEKTTLNQLVQALNELGTNPEDLISIFQALKKNGALTGDLEFI